MTLSQWVRPETAKAAGRLLAAAAASALVFLLWEIFLESPDKEFKRFLAESRRPVRNFKMPQSSDGLKRDILSYEEAVSKKSVFLPTTPSTAMMASGANTEANPLQDIALVGILPGDVPQAILEDKKNQRSYYLSAGQSSNDITVEEIHADRVTVSAGGQKKALTL